MPRQPKPYFRKAQKRWVCTINGNRVTLGKTKDEAMAKYYKLILKPQTVSSELSTIYGLSQVYLDWVEKRRKKSTYDNHKRCLKTLSSPLQVDENRRPAKAIQHQCSSVPEPSSAAVILAFTCYVLQASHELILHSKPQGLRARSHAFGLAAASRRAHPDLREQARRRGPRGLLLSPDK